MLDPTFLLNIMADDAPLTVGDRTLEGTIRRAANNVIRTEPYEVVYNEFHVNVNDIQSRRFKE